MKCEQETSLPFLCIAAMRPAQASKCSLGMSQPAVQLSRSNQHGASPSRGGAEERSRQMAVQTRGLDVTPRQICRPFRPSWSIAAFSIGVGEKYQAAWSREVLVDSDVFRARGSVSGSGSTGASRADLQRQSFLAWAKCSGTRVECSRKL